MLFVAISHPDEFVRTQSLLPEEIQGVELCLDRFPEINRDLIQEWIQISRHPLMLTLRKSSHGGKFSGSEAERESLIERLLSLEPDFFDLEYDMNPDFLNRVIERYNKTKMILSYHSFHEPRPNLHAIYQNMEAFPAYGYKIAIFTESTNDALRMLLFAKSHSRLSVICMGDRGQFSRILGPVFGNLIDYASLQEGKETAPGQISVQDMIQIYGYSKLGSHTRLYGLIGDPVSESQSHIYHNRVFREKQLDCVYVKMQVKPEELMDFFPLAQQIGFRGLSVTMPLKEKILPFLQKIEPKAISIGAINTLVLTQDFITGSNTDGIGALDAIEKRRSVFEKKVVLIGAGGAARAIAFEAHRRGAFVFIVNRTLQKAHDLAKDIGCQSRSFSDFPSEYDILINCSPILPDIDLQKILPTALAMDIVYRPRETPFLSIAKSAGCEIVYGDEMFFNQAAAQFIEWF